LQPTVGVFLGDRDHEPQIGLDHLLLGPARLAFTSLDGLHDSAELIDRQLRLGSNLGDGAAQLCDVSRMPFVQFCPTTGGQHTGTIEPIRGELAADVVLKKFRALDPSALGHSQQFSFLGDKPAIHVVELLDEMFDARIIEAHPLDVVDHCRL